MELKTISAFGPTPVRLRYYYVFNQLVVMACKQTSIDERGVTCAVKGDNVTFLWNFGDGTPTVTTNTPYVYHAFTQPACYYVNNTAFNVISRYSSNLTLVCVEDELLNLNINTNLTGSFMPAPFVMTMSSGTDFVCDVWTGDGATYMYAYCLQFGCFITFLCAVLGYDDTRICQIVITV